MPTTSSSRFPGLANTAFVAALLVTFGGFALTSRQAGPPPIAEFAPQALKQIDEAPEDSELSRSSTGSGAAGAAGGESAAPEEPDAVVPEEEQQPEVGPDGTPVEPPRYSATCANGLQSRFDPQSPPCMPFVPPDMDNGGATAPGVTADIIKVAFAIPGDANAASAERRRAHAVLGSFFSTNFVTYGRRFEFVDYSDQWNAALTSKSDAQWRSVAADLAAQGVFAVVGRQMSTEFEFELARKKVLSINSDTLQLESAMSQYAPYLWAYAAGGDTQTDGLARYTCAKLVGKESEYAGPRPGRALRRFAIVIGELETTGGNGPLAGQLQQAMLRTCGVDIPDKHVLYFADYSEATYQKRQEWAVSLIEDGVTTILHAGNHFVQLELSKEFTTFRTYYPEWVGTSFTTGHTNANTSLWGSPEARRSFIGLNYGSQNLLPSRTPALATLRYQDPAWQLDPSEGNTTYEEVYKPLLILASGVQLAGPNLTPQTFEEGLHRTAFPNPPDARQLGKVGFDTGDHTFVDDAIESFWSEGATGPDGQNAGAWCYPVQQRFGFQGRNDWNSDTSRYFRSPCETGRGI